MIILAKKILPITRPDIAGGAVVIKGKKIIDVGPRRRVISNYPGMRVIDLGDRVLMPGLVNAHTHLELSYLKEIRNEAGDFFGWINALVDKRRTLGSKGLKSAAKKALSGVLSTGTTFIGDISSTEAAVPVITAGGIRANVFLEVIGLDPENADETMGRLKKRLDSLKRLPDRISAGISPHAPYSVSDKLFRLLSTISSTSNFTIALHLSETYDEMLHIKGRDSRFNGYLKRFGWDKFSLQNADTPLGLVKGYGLHRRLLAVHGVHLTARDIRTLSACGASVAHCPRSNHMLGVGKAPVRKLIEGGVNVCLGTDSLASNMDLDMWDEMRFACLVNGLSPRQVIEMATINGAIALGAGGTVGSVEPGKDADLIAVDTDASKSRDPFPHLLYETKKQDVALGMVQGRPVYVSDTLKGCDGL